MELPENASEVPFDALALGFPAAVLVPGSPLPGPVLDAEPCRYMRQVHPVWPPLRSERPLPASLLLPGSPIFRCLSVASHCVRNMKCPTFCGRCCRTGAARSVSDVVCRRAQPGLGAKATRALLRVSRSIGRGNQECRDVAPRVFTKECMGLGSARWQREGRGSTGKQYHLIRHASGRRRAPPRSLPGLNVTVRDKKAGRTTSRCR